MQKYKRFLIGCIIGTRPELIKMAPIIFKLQKSTWAKVVLINTAQHRSLLDDMFALFGLVPDIDLNSMTENQTLPGLTSVLCTKIDSLLKANHFDAILAAGDTTTVFTASLIAFYNHIPYGHIEAGLRTFNTQEPFPEEINRVLTAPLASWHFAPTTVEKENLEKENIQATKIVVTGNPVIDALYWVIQTKPDTSKEFQWPNSVIVTAHRRENFGQPLKNICQAVIELSERFKHLNFVFPVHPNPNVQKEVQALLQSKPRIHLLKPLKYDQFAHLMNHAFLILTDSGGIQEEAPALGKPVLVLRNITERPAIIEAGVGILVGTETENIVIRVSEIISNKTLYTQMARGVSPYGDGHAAERIVNTIWQNLILLAKEQKNQSSTIQTPKSLSKAKKIQPGDSSSTKMN